MLQSVILTFAGLLLDFLYQKMVASTEKMTNSTNSAMNHTKTRDLRL